MGITMDPTNAGDHEPTIERHNRVWKERIRVLEVKKLDLTINGRTALMTDGRTVNCRLKRPNDG